MKPTSESQWAPKRALNDCRSELAADTTRKWAILGHFLGLAQRGSHPGGGRRGGPSVERASCRRVRDRSVKEHVPSRPQIVRQDDASTLVASLGAVPPSRAKPVASSYRARLHSIAKQPDDMDQHQLQCVVVDRSERGAIATATRSGMESIRVVASTALAAGANPSHRQQLRQLEAKSKGKCQLEMPCPRGRVHRDRKDAEPRTAVKATGRVHARAVPRIGLELQHLQPLFRVTTLRKCML